MVIIVQRNIPTYVPDYRDIGTLEHYRRTVKLTKKERIKSLFLRNYFEKKCLKELYVDYILAYSPIFHNFCNLSILRSNEQLYVLYIVDLFNSIRNRLVADILLLEELFNNIYTKEETKSFLKPLRNGLNRITIHVNSAISNVEL
jgi:hypothetical protein